MPTQCSRDLFGFAPVEGRRVEAAFDGGNATSDAGALLLGATDRVIGLVTRFAACFDDGRVQGQVEHSIESMVAQRVFGIALGYEDLTDHDQVRHYPVSATLTGKLRARRRATAPHSPARARSTGSSTRRSDLRATTRLAMTAPPSSACSSTSSSRRTRHRPATPCVDPRRHRLTPVHGHRKACSSTVSTTATAHLPLYVFCGSQLLGGQAPALQHRRVSRCGRRGGADRQQDDGEPSPATAAAPAPRIATSNILFICGGTFSTIEEIIARRVGRDVIGFGRQGRPRGPWPRRRTRSSAPRARAAARRPRCPAGRRAARDELVRCLSPKDLIEFGMIPEFVGRLPVVATLETLDKRGAGRAS